MPTAQQLMKATLVAAVILVPAAARAVSNGYDASKCHGVTHRDEQYLVRYAGTLQYWPSGTSYPDSVDVVCPITKTTSGPGITNDGLSVKASGYTSWATCTLSEYQSTINVNSNVLWQSEDDGSGYSYTMSMYGNHSNYWGSSSSWSYAELHCQLGEFATLQKYTVTEEGTVQANRRISSAAACAQTPQSDSFTYFLGAPHVPYTSPDPGQPGGFVEAYGGHAGFKMNCPMPSGAGSYVQIALGPAIGGKKMGCRASNGNTFTYVSGSEWDWKDLVFPNSGALVCAMQNDPSDGDGKVVSYRTQSRKTF